MTVDPIVQRERDVQTKLRALAFFVGLVASVLLVFSFLDVASWDREDTAYPIDDAWGWAERAWLVVVVAPSAWVLREPTKKVVLLWSAWFIAASLAFQALFFEGTVEVLRTDPFWVKPTMTMMVIALFFIIVFIAPAIRLKTPAPAGPPRARIHRG